MIERTLNMLDLNPEHGIEIVVDRSHGGDTFTLWVNVDGLCRLRASGVSAKAIKIEDNREK